MNEALALALHEQTSNAFETADLKLTYALKLLTQARAAGPSDAEKASALLRSVLEDQSIVRSIEILDEFGRLVFSSGEVAIGADFSDRTYFQVHRNRAGRQAFISEPSLDRPRGTWLISLSQPLHSPDGRFQGAIAATIDTQYFKRVWNKIDLGENGVIVLFRRDGTLIMRSPIIPESYGKKFPFPPSTAKLLAAASAGTYHAIGEVDKIWRRFSYHLLSFDPDLVLLVGRSDEAILAEWWRTAYAAALGWLAAISSIGALLYWLQSVRRREQESQAKAEREIRGAETRYRILYDANPFPIYVVDIETLKFLAVNQAAVTHYGWSREEFLAMTVLEIRPSEDVPRLMAALRDHPRERSRLAEEWRHRTKDGRVIEVEISSNPIDFGGRRAMLTLASDVTERKRVSRALKEAEARLLAMMHNSPMAVTLKDVEGRHLFVSKRFEEWFGKRLEDVTGKTMAEAFPDRNPAQTLAQERDLMASGRSNRQDMEFEFPDGSLHHLDIVKFLVPGTVPAIGSIMIDATAQRQAEAQLRQAQKMEAMGQLTGGIAHDFNNLLTVVLGNAELLAAALRGDPKLGRIAAMISMAAKRGADLTARLLAFARKQTLQPRITDINDFLERNIDLLRRTLGEHIEIKLVRGGGLKPVMVDPAQLDAAILNLAVNARDAMPGGGKLTLETANVELDQAYALANEGAVPGLYIRISVTDTGTGMAPETLTKAFDPFFTTKEVGKGTGLGLSMVYGFAKQMGGHLKIYSEVGHGTTVNLYLPQSGETGESTATAAEPDAPVEAAGGRETILMVEDDAMVRAYVESQLAELGYRVLVAGNGTEALEALRRAGAVDLLFTDIVMPGGMTGPQLAAEALRLQPALKILYTSGYAESAFGNLVRLGNGIDLLSKPYLPHDLAAKLRKIFDR